MIHNARFGAYVVPDVQVGQNLEKVRRDISLKSCTRVLILKKTSVLPYASANKPFVLQELSQRPSLLARAELLAL